jgi:hypothetical protein
MPVLTLDLNINTAYNKSVFVSVTQHIYSQRFNKYIYKKFELIVSILVKRHYCDKLMTLDQTRDTERHPLQFS